MDAMVRVFRGVVYELELPYGYQHINEIVDDQGSAIFVRWALLED